MGLGEEWGLTTGSSKDPGPMGPLVVRWQALRNLDSVWGR